MCDNEEVTALSLHSIEVRLGGVEILRGLDLTVDSGTSLALLGPSGSGKTTLLQTIVGLQRPSKGHVVLGGNDITHLPTHERGIALVSQSPALQPNITLAANVERPLAYTEDQPKAQRRLRAFRELRRFRIGRLGERRPNQTSVGEQHIAATARGTVRRAAVLLLDEPVIAVDPVARRSMIRQIREQQRLERTTMVVATNDWEVAAGLADRLAVLTEGRISQSGTAQDLYDQPANLDVAGLTGRWELNRLAGRVRPIHGERTEIVTAAGALRTWRTVAERPMIVGIRPEDLEIVGADTDTAEGGGRLEATVTSAAVLGRTTLVHLDADGIPMQAMGPTPAPAVGSVVAMVWRRAHLFDLNGIAFDHLD